MITNLTARTVASLKPGATARYVVDTKRRRATHRRGDDRRREVVEPPLPDRSADPRRLTLGSYPTLSLADARQRVREARKQVLGRHRPGRTQSRQRRDADTVGDFAKTYIEKHARKKNTSWKDMDASLRRNVLPAWRHKLMRGHHAPRRAGTDLTRIAKRPAPISANRVRALLSKFFNVAIQDGRRRE